MPPVTRKVSANASAGVPRKAPSRKPRVPRPDGPSESWGFLSAEHEHEQNGHADANSAMDDEIVATRELTDIDRALDPLREMAERVGREVETFAVLLDQFLEGLPGQKKKRFDAVLGLVEKFKADCKDAAFKLEESNQCERAEQLRREWSAQAKLSTNAAAPYASTTNKLASQIGQRSAKLRQWRQCKQEADLWELFDIILRLHHNPDRDAVQEQRASELAELGRPHRYTSESEIWEHFLLSDDLAHERSLIKRWLEQTVDHQESDLPGIVEELESRANRGKGLWSNGWTNTREKIKGEKRLRSWPTSPGAPLPQIRNAENTELLVTTLDPDARSRQDRTLETEDMYFERAMWIACWEMLRRGKSWNDVSKWCESRKEGWRALSIGKGSDTSQNVSNAAWRKMCYLASQSGCSNDYEAAVYGLLGGSVKAVNKVCRTVDDTLYAYYSATLLRQFDQYVTVNFPERAPLSRRVNEDSLQNPEIAIVSLIQKLREHPTTSTESVQPMKIVQSYLLANDVGSLIHTLGHAIAHLDSQNETPSNMIVSLDQFWQGKGTMPEAEVALDSQTLRIVNHMAILLRVLSEEKLVGADRDAEENVTVAYIQALRAARKRDLVPLYASRLTPPRALITVSQVLQDATDHDEQVELLRLLEQYHLDNVSIVNEQLQYALDRNIGEAIDTPLKMLEYNTSPVTYPGQCIVSGFFLHDPTKEDEAVVRSLRWFTIIEGHWADMFSALSLAMRKCLVAGRLACAVAIVEHYPFDEMSRLKSYSMLGQSYNMNDFEGAPSDVDPEQWLEMLAQSKTYRELENLVRAIASLAGWRDAEYEYTRNHQKQFTQSRGSNELKDAKTAVDECMEPILKGILNSSTDPDEAADLEKIRIDYIPEVVLAYNTVLHTAGSLISRQNLIASMDLSVTVANEENGISETFVKAKRMRELVTSFAMTSKAMLVLKDAGREFKPKRDREGKDLGMWETKAPEGTTPMLEDEDVQQQISH